VHVPAQCRPRGLVRRSAAAVTVAALLVSSAACTEDPEPAEPTGQESPSPTEGETSTLEPKPAQARVRVTRVAGTLRPQEREVLADNVGKVVSAYFADAYLGGEQPRTSFGDAFDTFTADAARQARKHKDLLTNELLGPTTESVVARRQTAYLAVLAPRRVAAGVTARVDLRYLAERADKPDQMVEVKGRLMLTRAKDGGWKIFGYDLKRSATAAEEGS
jgi:transposase